MPRDSRGESSGYWTGKHRMHPIVCQCCRIHGLESGPLRAFTHPRIRTIEGVQWRNLGGSGTLPFKVCQQAAPAIPED